MSIDNTHELLSIRNLTSSAYVLRLSRRGLAFKAGQHILLGQAGSIHNREYSIYSGEEDDFFEVLVKEVDDGLVSKQLKKVKLATNFSWKAHLVFLQLIPNLIDKAKFLFVATGTGIAPFS
jgi:ferredoxin/flavodoxin---NADP+ reductase